MAKPDPDLSRDFKRNFVIAELLSGRIKMIYHDADLWRQVASKVNQPEDSEIRREWLRLCSICDSCVRYGGMRECAAFSLESESAKIE